MQKEVMGAREAGISVVERGKVGREGVGGERGNRRGV